MKSFYTPLPFRGKGTPFSRPGLFFLFLFICYGANAQLPQAARQRIDTALKNWNTNYGANVIAVSWSYESTITTEQQRLDALNEITDPAKAWLPTGDYTVASSVSAQRIIEDTSIKQPVIDSLKTVLNSQFKIGHYKVRVNWLKGTQSFTTLLIANDSVPVYDNMFGNIALVSQEVNSLVAVTKQCLNLTIYWIWGGVRGKITASVTTNCDANGYVISCDKDCFAYCTLGEAKIECTTQIVGNGRCCQLSYSWAWAVGFKSIKVKVGGGGFEIVGILGSGGAANGSCTVCCDPVNTFATAPSAMKVNSTCESGQLRINWQATSVIRFARYTVEKSLDGISWNVAGYIDAGAATAPINSYSFKETSANGPGNFYRIIGEQVNGVKAYSSLVPSACGVVQNITVWPNPARGMTTVRIPAIRNGVVTIKVSNSQGFEVFKQQYNLHVGNNQFQIDMKNFASGIYTVSATGEGINKVYRLIKSDSK